MPPKRKREEAEREERRQRPWEEELTSDEQAMAPVGGAHEGIYCMILSHPYPTLKKPFHVMLTTDPLRTLVAHNQRRSRLRATRLAAPFCYPLRVAGRFFLDETALSFADALVHGTRGLDSLCEHFDNLASMYGLTLYPPDMLLVDAAGQPCTLAQFLREGGAPASFVEAATVLDECYRILCPAAPTEPSAPATDATGARKRKKQRVQ